MKPGKAVETIEGSNAILYRLALFSNTAAVLDRIPSETSGIYAWYRSYSFSKDPDSFTDELLKEISKPRFTPRTGFITPYYQVTVASQSKISDSKEQHLRGFLSQPTNREALLKGLEASLFFQTPLYIGKSENLRRRVGEHLDSSSPLSERFKAHGIDITSSLLLIIPLYGTDPIPQSALSEEPTAEQIDAELMLEEIFSRLFSPQLTIRIG
jgi:hypothetical protein